MFCPCMGRFGNQMEQFLGALSFAKDLNRTLVLPHLVEYPERTASSNQIPFQTYFKVEPLEEYTKVILMDDFMKYIAPEIWPKGKRTSFCYAYRKKNDCQAKDGNPFGPYWNKFGIDFDNSVEYGPLSYDLSFDSRLKSRWETKFPSEKHPVMAFAGAPGAFPILAKDVPLQKYLKWSDYIEKKSDDFINKFKESTDETFLGVHLRIGSDFQNACEHAREAENNFFGSAQCLGYNLEHGKMTYELCYPSEKTIIGQIKKALKKGNYKFVYVAADSDHLMRKFEKTFKNVKFVKYSTSDPHADLSILGKADHAIVNCVSTFSAFIKRQRDSEGKTTEFWAFKPKKKTTNTEL